MKPEAQRIAIAEACGWVLKWQNQGGAPLLDTKPKGHSWEVWLPPHSDKRSWGLLFQQKDVSPPDYLNDLNAMHEAWTTMSLYDRNMFTGELIGIVQRTPGAGTLDAINATAAQRAEAFLKTLNLWTE